MAHITYMGDYVILPEIESKQSSVINIL